MKTFFGLDFGTTNSALSVNENGVTHLLDIDKFNIAGKTMRSILFFNENGNHFVGQNAINEYIKNNTSGRLIQSIKTSLPHKHADRTNICGNTYTLEDLIAVILKHIKKEGERHIGLEINDVIIGIPAVFSENKEENKLAKTRLYAAAQYAGFKNIRFQFEPIAAALSFEDSLKNTEEKKVFIGDFGGGTSDFAVIKLKGKKEKITKDRKKDILSVDGITIGGDAFDSLLMWEKLTKYFGKNVKYKSMSGYSLNVPQYIMQTICKWHLIPNLRNEEIYSDLKQIKLTADDIKSIQNLETLIRGNYALMLFQAIEETKYELSLYDNSQINYENGDFKINENITRVKFEEIINEDIEKIKKSVQKTLLKSGLSEKKIDFVILTGGTSYIPCVKNIFVNKFGADKIKETDAFTSVAYGLGLSGYLFE